MRNLLFALACSLTLGFAAAPPAAAAVLDFKYEEDFVTVKWRLPEQPTPDSWSEDDFHIDGPVYGVIRISPGILPPDVGDELGAVLTDLKFRTDGAGGGLGFTFGVLIPDFDLTIPLDWNGPQLFTGPTGTPTFLTGVFDLVEAGACTDCGASDLAAGPRLTITVAGVPEPATWALMIGGFGAAGAVLRRRRALVA